MLKNKNIFITGGNRGIGRGLVNILEKDNNVIFSVRESAKGEEVIRDFKSQNVKYVVLDVDDFESVHQARKAIKSKMDTIDVLFNNAGILIPQYDVSAVDTPEESILKTFQTKVLLGLMSMRTSLSGIHTNSCRNLIDICSNNLLDDSGKTP